MDAPQGPNEQTLKGLSEMMPSMIKGAGEGKIRGKGKPVPLTAPRPTKVCRVCCKTHDYKRVGPDSALTPEDCPDCAKLLKQGWTALICSNRYAFVKISKSPELGGEVVHMNSQQMDKIEQEYKVNWKPQEDESHQQT